MERVRSAVAFSGRIKSGKTTIARRVADELSIPFASFGDFLRAEAERLRLDSSDRVVLQQLGQEFVEAGLSRFCEQVLLKAGWKGGMPAVVDGVRHLDVLQHLRVLLSPIPVKLVFVVVSDGIQAARFADLDNRYSCEDVESHPTELDVKSKLFHAADKVIDAEADLTAAVSDIVGSLR